MERQTNGYVFCRFLILILIVYYQSTQINGIQIQILAYISSCMIQTDQIARSKAAVIIITGTVNRSGEIRRVYIQR